MEVNITHLTGQLYWWRELPWSKAHISENCVAAFMEHPGRWGVDRMYAGRQRRALREKRGLCMECGERFTRARLAGHAALEQRAAEKRERRR